MVWERRGIETDDMNVPNEAPGGEEGRDEQYLLLKEIFYSSDTEIGRTPDGATSRISRTTTEEVPYRFESSNEYEGLENNRHVEKGDAEPEDAAAEPDAPTGEERGNGAGIINPPTAERAPPDTRTQETVEVRNGTDGCP